jgi:hypothetical protein
VLIFVRSPTGNCSVDRDNKVTLVNGVATVVKTRRPDTLTVIDIKAGRRVVAEVDVPSVVGPPFSGPSPDESIALVTANGLD